MARIPKEEIERLKAEVSVQQLAEVRGIKLERHGTDLIGLCPYHDDKQPSLVITPTENLWNCLGSWPRRGFGNRLGDEKPGRKLPACGGAAASESSFFSRGRKDCAESNDGCGETAGSICQ
jgi:hypothetical protein